MSVLPAEPIFISYSRRDEEIMRKIAFFLRDQGFKVWVDNEKLIPGTPAWEESIEIAIKNALAVIVILSPDSKNSEWVRREITYSDQFSKRVFPILIKGTEEVSLPIRLVTRQYIDLRQDEEAGLNALSSALRFYIDQKQTLEMKRPSVQKASAGSADPTPIASVVGRKKSSTTSVLYAGLLIAVCVIGLGALGLGYGFFSSFIPWTGSNSVTPSNAAREPTDTATEIDETSPPIDIPTDSPPPVEAGDSTADGILSQYFTDYQVVNIDTFDRASESRWEVQGGNIENGVMEIIGNENYDGAWFPDEFVEGNAILLDFNFSGQSTFLVYLNFGSYGVDSFRRFGMYVENGTTPITDLYNPDYLWGGYVGNLATEPGNTYTLLFAILPGGEILDVVWDPANPDQKLEYRNTFDESWAGLPWTLVIQAEKGTIDFDNFQVVKFSGTK